MQLFIWLTLSIECCQAELKFKVPIDFSALLLATLGHLLVMKKKEIMQFTCTLSWHNKQVWIPLSYLT
jgi:glycopeptide antibiotics resistance protein